MTRIGILPGATKSGNQFVDIYSDGVRAAGCDVIAIDKPFALSEYQMDLLHLHWPDQIYWRRRPYLTDVAKTVRFLRQLSRLRAKGVKIVWMVHNIDPHDQNIWRKMLWAYYKRKLCRLIDGFLTLSPATVAEVKHAYPELADKPSHGLWHPAYPASPQEQSPQAIRGQLGIGPAGRLFGCLGMMRPYKGIEKLIAAFRALPDPNSHLLIAGRPVDRAYADSIRALAETDKRITVADRELSDAEYADFERACDVIILPFSKTLHSGSMVHALSEGVAVLTPPTPFSRALATEVGSQWVRAYKGELTPDDLDGFQVPQGKPQLDDMAAEKVGEQAAGFYRALCRGE